MNFLEWLRVFVLGIIEGVTEWLPVSSTGHLILMEALWKGNAEVFTEEFVKVFDVVIQFGAIMAVVTNFFHKLNPISNYKSAEQKKNTWLLWGKIVIATLPAMVFGLLLDDFMEEHLYNWAVVSAMLILYGIAFIYAEIRYHQNSPTILRFSGMTWKTALFIGLFQVLSLVPGTSRSGVTIIGALFLGCSRYIATEFTFYLAIPVMLGASVLKMFKYFIIKHQVFTGAQTAVMVVSMLIAYVVSLFVVKFLVKYVKRHNFVVFGYYRIILGLVVILIFATGLASCAG